MVNADDFGFTHDVNAGIVQAHTQGVLTATTLMANGTAFDHAVRLAREHPRLDVGCHLVLVGGRSVRLPDQMLPETPGRLVHVLATGRLSVYEELLAQVERILAAGLRPVHLDTHKHTHVLPPVLRAVAKLSREFGIPWVRRPFDFPLTGLAAEVPWTKRVTAGMLRLARFDSGRVLRHYGCRATDHFAGFRLTGRFHARQLVSLIQQLPAGVTEFMCHPGLLGPELQAASTRLKQSRVDELHALIAPEVRQALKQGGVRLVSYRDLM